MSGEYNKGRIVAWNGRIMLRCGRMSDGPCQRIDNRIARNRNRVVGESLTNQIGASDRSGRKMKRRQFVRKDSVRLLREWNIHSPAAQSGFDVSDGDLSIKR